MLVVDKNTFKTEVQNLIVKYSNEIELDINNDERYYMY